MPDQTVVDLSKTQVILALMYWALPKAEAGTYSPADLYRRASMEKPANPALLRDLNALIEAGVLMRKGDGSIHRGPKDRVTYNPWRPLKAYEYDRFNIADGRFIFHRNTPFSLHDISAGLREHLSRAAPEPQAVTA